MRLPIWIMILLPLVLIGVSLYIGKRWGGKKKEDELLEDIDEESKRLTVSTNYSPRKKITWVNHGLCWQGELSGNGDDIIQSTITQIPCTDGN